MSIKKMEFRESKEEVRIANVPAMHPQILYVVLVKKGMCIAFVCIGMDSTTVQIGLCQDENFELEVEKELV